MLLQLWIVGVYWIWLILVAQHTPEPYKALLLSREDRLTREEEWQLRNFGVIRKDFMGWVIERTMDRLLDGEEKDDE